MTAFVLQGHKCDLVNLTDKVIQRDYPLIAISWASLICHYYLEMHEYNALFHWNDLYCLPDHVSNRNLLCPISHQQTRVMEGARQPVLREHRLCDGSRHQCQRQWAAEHVQRCRHSLPDRQQCVRTHRQTHKHTHGWIHRACKITNTHGWIHRARKISSPTSRGYCVFQSGYHHRSARPAILNTGLPRVLKYSSI